ncbi:MAG: hypothetical protein JO107_14790 [Hyphomicrobiales bacterium]|nr:hypothetical protein [Hyphomicrobiales bacterium]MBV8664357.1 hypothetical protein [Hyphomicrobiales bacterium]
MKSVLYRAISFVIAAVLATATTRVAIAATVPPPAIVSPSGSLTFTPAFVVNAGDPAYGAKCDGSSDVGPAINLAVQAIRNQSQLSSYSWPIGVVGRLVLPSGKCVIKTPLNFTSVVNSTGPNTQLYGSGFVADFWGTELICETNGAPCIDATGLGQASLNGLNIYGSCTSGQTPNVGLILARPTTSLSAGADSNHLVHPTINGCFSLTAYYNRSSETTSVDHGAFYNWSPNAYAGVFDGSNYFNVQSAYTGETYTQNVFSSFNETSCFECLFEAVGSGGIPLWIGGTDRLSLIRSYAAATNSGGGPGAILFFGNNVPNDFLNLDVHFENATLGSLIEVIGTTTPVIHHLSMNDPNPFNSGPIFLRGTGVTAVTIQDADLHFGTLSGTNPSWWDNANDWTVSGYIYDEDGSYVAPGTFSGTACVASTCTSYQSYSPITAPSVNAPTISATNLNASTVSNPGQVTALTVDTPANNAASEWSTPSLAGSLPSVVITPSNGIGGGAQAALQNIVVFVTPTISGGAGCSTGDTFNLIDPQSGGNLVGGGTVVMTATATSGGSVTGTGWGATSGNAYLFNKPMSAATALSARSTTCTTLPTVSMNSGYINAEWSISNGSGSLKATLSVTSDGAGYTATPNVSFSPTFTTVYSAPVSVTLSSSMSISAGAGSVGFDFLGTELGIQGPAGNPVRNYGATIDGSCVRYTLTTSGYTVPANTDCIRFTQSSTLASATVTLPTAFADGQPIQFVNYAGAITALTFSPSVNGWTNGSAMAANTGLRIRWDATASAWYREQ